MLADRIPASELRRLRALCGEARPRWRDVIAEAAVVFLVGCIGSFALGVVYFEAIR